MNPSPNFREIIFALERKTGLRSRQIAMRIGVPESTFNTWKNREIDPLFSHGMRLLDYYVKECGPEIPRLDRVASKPSAARCEVGQP